MIPPVLSFAGSAWWRVTALDRIGVRSDRFVNRFVHQAKTAVGEVRVMHSDNPPVRGTKPSPCYRSVGQRESAPEGMDFYCKSGDDVRGLKNPDEGYRPHSLAGIARSPGSEGAAVE
jgi:hypothetical protein